MIRKSLRLALAISCLSLATVPTLAQDFQKSYPLAEGNKVSIKNVAGNVLVQSYDGTEIMVAAFKEGRDRDRLTIKDFSDNDKVDIRVDYPQDCNCEASIRFEVKVPRGVYYDYDALSTVAGDIKIMDIKGMIRADNISGLVLLRNVSGMIYASSFSGDVVIEQATEGTTRSNGRWRRGYQRYLPGAPLVGAVLAKSTSGNVKVDLVRLAGSSMSRMEFSSLSGNVEVKMPESLGAMVEMTTLIGKLETDFPLTIVKSEFVPGASARGRVGDGSRELKISSVTGNVALRKN
jgi:DUF4097 and DUF4098 domain-containing protein YvlB